LSRVGRTIAVFAEESPDFAEQGAR